MSTSPTWPELLTNLLDGSNLTISEASWSMRQIMSGDATAAQLAAFLIALKAKGATVGEIVGFRDAVLEHARPLALDSMALDIVGTGGDRFGTVNVSTMASIVAAAAGAPVIKHGNRAASSASGSSDVLAALGLQLELDEQRVAEVFSEVGITFVHAAHFHPGFRHAAEVRRDIGIPTVFNFLGPLCNPARCEANAVGVADASKIPLFVGVFQTRGATALVFRGDDGLDELTTTGHSHIWEVSRGAVTEHDLDPQELGIPRASLDDLVGAGPEHNAVVARTVFAGERGPVRDIVLLNAAAGLVSFSLAQDPADVQKSMVSRLKDKLDVAAEAIDSGAASRKLAEWVSATQK